MVRWINIKSLLFQALEGLFEVYQWFYVTTFWNLLLMINAIYVRRFPSPLNKTSLDATSSIRELLHKGQNVSPSMQT